MSTDAFYLFELERRGPKLLRRVALGGLSSSSTYSLRPSSCDQHLLSPSRWCSCLPPSYRPPPRPAHPVAAAAPGAIAQLLVNEARTQLGVVVLGENDEVVTVREMGFDLDRSSPLEDAISPISLGAFPGCTNLLLTGVVDALQRGHQAPLPRLS